MHQRLNRAIFSFAVFFGSLAFAAMEFPPEVRTPEQMEEYIAFLRERVESLQVQGADQHIRSLVPIEQTVVQRLRENPRFMAAANERPPLLTLNISFVTLSEGMGRGVTQDWYTFIQQSRQQLLPQFSQTALDQRISQWKKKSTQNFFSALARVLPEENRELLSLANLEQRWQSIRRILERMPEENLRAQIDGGRLGLPADWRLEHLDRYFIETFTLENEIAALVQMSVFGPHPWILQESLPPTLRKMAQERKVVRQLESLRARLEEAYINPNSRITVERPNLQLRLKEIPPYIAIWRGYVGRDCSTTSSWAFPYSPYERNWWIEDANGRQLGYVSGTITEYNNERVLYIRDIRFQRYLQRGNELVMKALYAARDLYGARHVTFVNEGIMGSLNADPHQRTEMTNLVRAMPLINQNFPDTWIRNEVLAQHARVSNSYDNPANQSRSHLLSFENRGSEQVRVQVVENGEITVVSPTENPDLFWDRLTLAVSSNDHYSLSRNYGNEVNWRAVISALSNQERLNVEAFQTRITEIFQAYGLPISRNIRKRHENAFLTGHLRAPDAFTPENQRQSFRFVIDGIWRAADRRPALAIIQEHLELFENSEMFNRAVQGLFQRRQPVDFERARDLFAVGYHFPNIQLDHASLDWLITNAETHDLIWFGLERRLPGPGQMIDANQLPANVLTKLARLLDNLDENIDFAYSVNAANALLRITGGAIANRDLNVELSTTLTEEEDLAVLFPAAVAFLRDLHAGPRALPFGSHDHSMRAYSVVVDHLESQEVPLEQRNYAREVLASMPERLRAQFHERHCQDELERRQAEEQPAEQSKPKRKK